MTARSDPAGETASRDAVSWVALPDRDTDRLHLAVWHLGAGVAGVFFLGIGVLLVFLALRSLADPDSGVLVLVVTLALVGGPASLLYLLLAAELGTDRERGHLLPSVEWLRGRYLPFALLGGVVLLAPLGVLPALVFVYPFAFVAAAAAVEGRYSLGSLDPTTATLRMVTGADAVEGVIEDADGVPQLDPDRRHVRSYDLSSLRRVHRRRVGDYVVFVPRYRRRGRWGRPLLLVVPATAADRVERAFDVVVRTSDWEPSEGMARPVRGALGGLGLVFLGTAGALVVLAGDRAGSVVSMAAILGGLGALMLVGAVRG